VAGFRHPAMLEPPLRADGTRDFRKLNGLLNQPNDAMGSFADARPVWHCALRAAPEDKTLSDDEWATIACDVMNRTGLSRPGEEGEAVRWIAVRHAGDHVHLVVMLARQDGRRPSVRNDRYRVRDACRAAEQRYGLRSTSPADRTAPRYPTRAENEQATRRGLEEAPRVTLRRAVSAAAASSATAEEFFARLQAAGITVRPRHSTNNPGQVTGYALSLPGDVTRDGTPVWYSGGKLAADLTWPKLAQRWHPARQLKDITLTDTERAALYEHAAKAAANATANIRANGVTNPAAAADAAQAAADTLHVAAAMLASRPLREAADSYQRAAREPYGRIPPPTTAGSQLRQAARIMAAHAHVSGDRANEWAIVIVRLAALAEAVAELRDAQQRAAQASAALTAAQQLRTVRFASPSRPPGPPRARTAADLAATSFPGPVTPPPARQPAPGQHSADKVTRRPAQPRPRGPTR
jgi:MobA/VirD2-like, nuclease domain